MKVQIGDFNYSVVVRIPSMGSLFGVFNIFSECLVWVFDHLKTV